MFCFVFWKILLDGAGALHSKNFVSFRRKQNIQKSLKIEKCARCFTSISTVVLFYCCKQLIKVNYEKQNKTKKPTKPKNQNTDKEDSYFLTRKSSFLHGWVNLIMSNHLNKIPFSCSSSLRNFHSHPFYAVLI